MSTLYLSFPICTQQASTPIASAAARNIIEHEEALHPSARLRTIFLDNCTPAAEVASEWWANGPRRSAAEVLAHDAIEIKYI